MSIESLESLRGFDPREPEVRPWNKLLEEIQAREVTLLAEFVGTSTAFLHPWKTVAGRWEEMPDGLTYPRGRVWRVAIAPGCVNDELASIVYLKMNDERGWLMPPDYAPPGGPLVVDRPLLDARQDEPPFLVVIAPETAAGNAQFISVAEASRLPFFRTAEMLEKRLFLCHIILTANPTLARFYLPPIPADLNRFRCYAGPRPGRGPAANGGHVALARLWLTREPDGNPEGDEIHVQQLVFWSLATRVALDSFSFGEVPVFQNLADLAQGGIDQDYSAAAEALFWTV
jgi:hypothetical protein